MRKLNISLTVIIPVIYFNFEKSEGDKYYAFIEIEETDSERYELIGYLYIKDPDTHYDRWRYVLYFK